MTLTLKLSWGHCHETHSAPAHGQPACAGELTAIWSNIGHWYTVISGSICTASLPGQTVLRQVSYNVSKDSPVGRSKPSPSGGQLSKPSLCLLSLLPRFTPDAGGSAGYGWDKLKPCRGCMNSFTPGRPWKTAAKGNTRNGQRSGQCIPSFTLVELAQENTEPQKSDEWPWAWEKTWKPPEGWAKSH